MVANVTDKGKILLRTATQNQVLGNGRIREAYVLWPDSLANPQGLASRFTYDEASQAQWLLCASANATKNWDGIFWRSSHSASADPQVDR